MIISSMITVCFIVRIMFVSQKGRNVFFRKERHLPVHQFPQLALSLCNYKFCAILDSWRKWKERMKTQQQMLHQQFSPTVCFSISANKRLNSKAETVQAIIDLSERKRRGSRRPFICCWCSSSSICWPGGLFIVCTLLELAAKQESIHSLILSL